MSEQQVAQHIVQQVIVPAYVWHDAEQQAALLTHIGADAARQGQLMRENLDHANATVTPIGMKAQVAHADVGSKSVGFVAYDTVDVEHADLVMVAVDFPIVPS